MTGPPEVFISYANSDGLELSRTLRACLVQEGITVWHEIEDMIGGERWQAQVEEALGQALFLVLVLTRGAVGSKWVAWECRKARQHGVYLLPIQPGDLDPARDFAALPQAIKAKHIYNDAHERERLILHIKSRPERPERVPFLAPAPPETYVQRTKEYMQLRALLLDERRENPVAITTALYGAGGFGKTTLAKALCHDVDIIDAFTDGILWVELGAQEPDVLGGLTSLYQALTGSDRPGFTRVEQAAQQLAARLEDKTALIVIDDVWRQSDLEPFLQGGKDCARLFTTRRLDLALALKAKQPVEVDKMTADESIALLRNQLGTEEFQAQADPDGLRDLARRLGEWPVLLELAGGALNELMYWGEGFAQALATIQQRYGEEGVRVFDREDETQRRFSIRKVIEVSLEFLGDEDKRRRYRELGIFPEDTDIPLTAVAALWGLGEPGTKALAVRLAGLSLLKLVPKAGALRLHDVLRRYLLEEVESQGDPSRLHGRLIAGWRDLYSLPDPYAWRYLTYHLLASGRRDHLRGLLLDDRWLRAKLQATDPIALRDDLTRLPEDPDLMVLRRALDLSAHILARDKAQLRSQLYGRLLGASSPVLRDLLDRLGASRDERPWLRPLTPSLTQPDSPLEWTLEGHTDRVCAVAVTADGHHALSGGADHTVRVWDLQTGTLERTLEGHTAWVNAVAVTADGRRALSAGWKGTVRVWDLQTGTPERTLEGDTGGVEAAAVTADGQRAISGGSYAKLEVWDLRTGKLERTLMGGHRGGVTAVAVTADGHHAISAGKDETVRVWDLQTGTLERTLEGHRGAVNAVAVTADGRRALSAGDDGTVRVWDLQTGTLERTLEGHRGAVNAVAVTADGRRALSAGWEGTVRVWDLRAGTLERTLEGHTDGGVSAVAVTADGRRALSASYAGTVRVWDLRAGTLERTPEGHTDGVRAVAVTADGQRAISGGADHTVRVWDLRAGTLEWTLVGHTGAVNTVAVTADGHHALSAGDDRTVRVWDLQTGTLERTLEGHRGAVNAVAVTADGRRALSAGDDRTVRVWDLQTGTLEWTLEGHRGAVNAVAVTADGHHALSAGRDRPVRVWDLRTGALERTLEGYLDQYHGGVHGVAVTADGHHALSAGAEGTVRVWDLRTGTLERTLEGHTDGGVSAVAVTADGRRALSASYAGTVRVWDLRAGTLEWTLVGHTDGGVRAVAVTADGQRALSAGWEGTVRVWDLQTGQLLTAFYGEAPVLSCAVTVDGTTVVAGDRLGRVHILRWEEGTS